MGPPAIPYPTSAPAVSSSSVLGNNAVWACVNILGTTVASFPWSEWKGDAQLAPSRLVRRPYEGMTRREWTWRVTAVLALHSVCYLVHVGGTDSEGAPWSLLPLSPDQLQPDGISDAYGIVAPTRYRLGSSVIDAASVEVIRRTPMPGIPDAYAGLLTAARRQLGAVLAADVASVRYWTAGGPVSTVITTDQELDAQQAEGIAQRWVERRSMGADYPAVLGKGAHAEPWGADPTAEAAVEVRREMVADIGRYFGVPTRLLNAPAGDTQTYSNVESEASDLLRYTLVGYTGPIEDAVSDLLPGDYLTGRRMVMDPSRFLQGDLESRARAWSQLVTAGIALPDEARTKGFGLAPLGAVAAPASTPEPLPAAAATGGLA